MKPKPILNYKNSYTMHVINSHRFVQGWTQQGKYSYAELDDMIVNQGYVPVASASELDNIRFGGSQPMGKNTPWSGVYSITITAKYVQIYNIDLSSITGFVALPSFSTGGIFDGNELVINNLYINTTLASQGLFIGLSGGSIIRNVRVTNGYITSTSTGLKFGFICAAITDGTIENCNASGEIYIPNGYVVGGIAGQLQTGLISKCFADVTLTGGRWTGGLIGQSANNGYLQDCSVIANITCTAGESGGIAGSLLDGTGHIKRCSSKGILTRLGGGNYYGGITGLNYSTIENCYSQMIINSDGGNKAGAIGRNLGGVVNNCYSTGSVQGVTNAGFCQTNSGTINYCYWDVTTSGQTTSAGGVGKTTAEMQAGLIPDTTIYEGWDPLIWDSGTVNDYPSLIGV